MKKLEKESDEKATYHENPTRNPEMLKSEIIVTPNPELTLDYYPGLSYFFIFSQTYQIISLISSFFYIH
jgi:hypothetical protein